MTIFSGANATLDTPAPGAASLRQTPANGSTATPQVFADTTTTNLNTSGIIIADDSTLTLDGDIVVADGIWVNDGQAGSADVVLSCTDSHIALVGGGGTGDAYSIRRTISGQTSNALQDWHGALEFTRSTISVAWENNTSFTLGSNGNSLFRLNTRGGLTIRHKNPSITDGHAFQVFWLGLDPLNSDLANLVFGDGAAGITLPSQILLARTRFPAYGLANNNYIRCSVNTSLNGYHYFVEPDVSRLAQDTARWRIDRGTNTVIVNALVPEDGINFYYQHGGAGPAGADATAAVCHSLQVQFRDAVTSTTATDVILRFADYRYIAGTTGEIFQRSSTIGLRAANRFVATDTDTNHTTLSTGILLLARSEGSDLLIEDPGPSGHQNNIGTIPRIDEDIAYRAWSYTHIIGYSNFLVSHDVVDQTGFTHTFPGTRLDDTGLTFESIDTYTATADPNLNNRAIGDAALAGTITSWSDVYPALKRIWYSSRVEEAFDAVSVMGDRLIFNESATLNASVVTNYTTSVRSVRLNTVGQTNGAITRLEAAGGAAVTISTAIPTGTTLIALTGTMNLASCTFSGDATLNGAFSVAASGTVVTGRLTIEDNSTITVPAGTHDLVAAWDYIAGANVTLRAAAATTLQVRSVDDFTAGDNVTFVVADSTVVLNLAENTVIKGFIGSTEIPFQTVTSGTTSFTAPGNADVTLYIKAPGQFERLDVINAGDGVTFSPEFVPLLSEVNDYDWLDRWDASFTDMTLMTDDLLTITLSDTTDIPTPTVIESGAIIDRIHQTEGYADLCLSRAAVGFLSLNGQGQVRVGTIDTSWELADTVATDFTVDFPLLRDDTDYSVDFPKNDHANKNRFDFNNLDAPLGNLDYNQITIAVEEAFAASGGGGGGGDTDISGLATSEQVEGIASDIAALNDFDPASDTVASVTTVTTNLDMRGTDNALLAASYTAPDNTSIAAILVDTDELQMNQGGGGGGTDISGLATSAEVAGIASDIAALNDFDPASDTVASVTTVTTNLDMRGTDNALLAASYEAPDNTSITAILADTNELQVNQGDFATATGFATSAEVAGVASAVAALNDFDPASDTVASVTTVTTNLDMRGTDDALLATSYEAPDNTSIAAILVDTDELQTNQSDFTTATGFATSAEVAEVSAVITLIQKYHDNMTRFFRADGTTETTQDQAHFMIVYDDDNQTPLKTIGFQNAQGTSVTIPNATRYVLL